MSWFSDFVDSIREAFSGNSSRSDSGGGSSSDRGPSRQQRPPQRPSIMTVERDDKMQRVATRDLPRFGISAGDSTDEPSYSPFSLRGLTSTDPANVMRNIQAAERNLRENPFGSEKDNDRVEPAPAAPVAEASAELSGTPRRGDTPPVNTDTGMTQAQEARIEQAGETAAEKQRKLGLAQTIATSPTGLLSTGETTRRRRSLIGGGLIK
jgi:hypothetical protein